MRYYLKESEINPNIAHVRTADGRYFQATNQDGTDNDDAGMAAQIERDRANRIPEKIGKAIDKILGRQTE